ncbi:LytS/YhcK type 5TM receptor domain-containing protein [Tissierella sp.]|uniref:LytS/YhcK type 5TM receptor domain-containing protein n=1 Tax=Tissierella sp. TaxID=41274 RepID=UPI00285EDFDB|nr:LytS/YhcK type 5TM receptor domain-containing protein [Tissierella sp.]MDR7857455.1 LytS/YhcK type 5TM receptor domain-containing protein [Tissierella sp.]
MQTIFVDLINRVGMIMILAFLMSRIKLVKRLLAKKDIGLKDKLILSIIFGVFGIFGTYIGINIDGGLANSRAIGVFVGGILGGPMVGILAGIIAGTHRMLIDINGLTTLACTTSTILTGIMAGSMSKIYYKSNQKYLIATVGGILAESLQMLLILLISRPFIDALGIVKVIAIPIIILNATGIFVFIAIIDNIFKEEERIAAKQAQVTLKIANRSFPYFMKGFNEETALQTSKIVQEMTDIEVVIFTDKERILSYVGLYEDNEKSRGKEIKDLTQVVIESGSTRVLNTKLSASSENKLGSAIIVPLKENTETIGTLTLYKEKEDSISQVDLELALGLGDLFSSQIALSKLEHQKQLLAKAELKALQSQINPHFLFNSINTIVSCTELEPKKAKDLLLHLGACFRKNLQQGLEEVNLFEEIEHIKSYLEIEKARFGQKLEVIFDIPDNLECYLPPLMLQPIVENAINHGIFEKLEGGIVKIKAIDENETTVLSVEDNGVGIKEEILSNLLNNNKNNDSIGLVNVNNRLKNKYGDRYGLEINSQYYEGTTVTMKIPKIREAEYNVEVSSC